VSSVRKKHCLVILLGGWAAVGGIALLLSTPWGLGLSPDSAVYIGAARSLVRGQGFSLPIRSGEFTPVVHYPPLYSAVLASIGLAGPDPLESARWLNALLFSANIFLVGWVAFAGTASFWLSVSASFCMITAFPIIQVHSMAWSEPLFILLELCGLLFLMSYIRRKRYLNLAVAALAIGLSTLTRYAGIAFIVSGIAALLLLNDERWKKRFLDTATFLAISALPTVLWMARNWSLAGSAVSRSVGFHIVGFEHLGAAAVTMLSWVSISWLLTTMEQAAVVFVLLALIALVIPSWTWRKNREAETPGVKMSLALPMMMFLIIAAYLLMLFATVSFLDHQTPIDSRILAPVYVAMVLMGISLIAILLAHHETSKRLPQLISAVPLILVGLQLPSTWQWVGLIYHDGVGYAARHWQESELVKRVSLAPLATPIFSNAPDVLYTLLGRPSNMIPRKVNPASRTPNDGYDSQLVQMKNEMKTNRGILVYFDRVQWRWYLPSPGELEGRVGLRLLVREKDGSIYQVD